MFGTIRDLVNNLWWYGMPSMKLLVSLYSDRSMLSLIRWIHCIVSMQRYELHNDVRGILFRNLSVQLSSALFIVMFEYVVHLEI